MKRVRLYSALYMFGLCYALLYFNNHKTNNNDYIINNNNNTITTAISSTRGNHPKKLAKCKNDSFSQNENSQKNSPENP